MANSNRNGTLTPSEDSVVTGLKLLSVEDILSVDDLPEQVIDVPEWGGQVRVKAFSKARELAIRNEAGGVDGLDNEKFEMLLFVYGVIDPVFTSEQVGLLKEKNGRVIDRVITRIMEMSGLTEEARQKAKSTFPS